MNRGAPDREVPSERHDGEAATHASPLDEDASGSRSDRPDLGYAVAETGVLSGLLDEAMGHDADDPVEGVEVDDDLGDDDLLPFDEGGNS